VDRIRRHPFVSAAALFLLLALGLTAWSGLTVWHAAHHDDASQVEHADAIVVLGAAQYDGTPSPVFEGRLDHALLLYQQGRSSHVFVLGSKQPADRTTEAAAGTAWLVAHGVPSSAVEPIPVGHTSWESLKAAAATMKRDGMRTAFLVSDPWHNARIKKMADDLGLDGYDSATWTSAYDTQGSRLGGYIRETFAYLEYRLFGGH
jgi:vancomycin permeability regulator SanA